MKSSSTIFEKYISIYNTNSFSNYQECCIQVGRIYYNHHQNMYIWKFILLESKRNRDKSIFFPIILWWFRFVFITYWLIIVLTQSLFFVFKWIVLIFNSKLIQRGPSLDLVHPFRDFNRRDSEDRLKILRRYSIYIYLIITYIY